MAYEKIVKRSKEYSGESYAESLTKKNSKVWGVNEIASYMMVDSNGSEITTGVLEISQDEKSLSFIVGKTITASLVGNYKIIVDLGDSTNAEVSDVIAEYDIEYSTRTAG